MSRFLSFLAAFFLSAVFAIGLVVPAHSVEAAGACRFACNVTFGAQAMNCDGSDPTRTGSSQPCAAQCTQLCRSLGMTSDASRASTCGTGRTCSPCSCVPTTSLSCAGTTAEEGNRYCASQCTPTCAAAAGELNRIQGAGSSITCISSPAPQCVVISRAAATRLCTACMTTCANNPARTSDPSPLTCYRTCQQGDTPTHSACIGVTETEAGIAGTSASTGGTGGQTGSTGGGTTRTQTGSGTTGGSSGTPAAPTQGSCNFACQPQTTPTTCTADSDCTTACQRVCGRSFQNGQCVTTGANAARCAPAGAGGTRQCVFECSIGTSTQERSCSPQGTGAQAPGTVCGSFCQESCRSASIGTVPAGAQFCGGSAPTCGTPGGGATAPTGGETETATPGGTSGGSGATQTLGAGAGGSRLTNPLPGIDSIAGLVGRLVKGILGVVGSLALLMFIYGGVKWILSAGDAKEISGSKNILRNATIGMLLIFFSYTISSVILGLVSQVGDNGEGASTNPANTGTHALSTCVEYAVSHGFIGRNEAQDTTGADWACRQTRTAERTDRSVCIARGCPNDPPAVLCCAPAAGASSSDSSVPAPTFTGGTEPGSSAGAATGGVAGGTAGGATAPTAGGTGTTAGAGTTGSSAPTTAPAAATTGCRTRIAASFHLRPAEMIESTMGTSIPGGTLVDVLGVGTLIRNGTLIHHIRIVNGAEGWAFLTRAEVDACATP